MPTVPVEPIQGSTSRPIFRSEALNKALEANRAVFDAYQLKLNIISEDIRSLERHLQARSIPHTFVFPLKEHSKDTALGRLWLCWGRFTDGQFRLLVSEDPGGTVKPLIDWPVE